MFRFMPRSFSESLVAASLLSESPHKGCGGGRTLARARLEEFVNRGGTISLSSESDPDFGESLDCI